LASLAISTPVHPVESSLSLSDAYGPATLVAPLGASSVISAAFLSHFFLKEVLTRRNVVGIFFAIAGAVMISLFAPGVPSPPPRHSHPSLTSQSAHEATIDDLIRNASTPVFIAYISSVAVAVAVLAALPLRIKQQHVVVYVLMCALIGGVCVMAVKAVAVGVKSTAFDGSHELTRWEFWLIAVVAVVTIVGQIRCTAIPPPPNPSSDTSTSR
jgi:magnesium transporter